MFYVSRGSIPPTRHTQHRAPDGSLYPEELFGVEGFTGRSSLLYHLSRRRGPADRAAGPRSRSRRRTTASTTTSSRDRGLVPTGDAISGRIPLFHNADVVMGVVRPAGPSPTPSTATARATRCCTSTRARASAGRTSATSPTTRATTSCSRSGRPGAWTRTRARPSGCCTSSARPSSSRPSGTATTTGSSWSTRPYSQRDIRIPEFREPDRRAATTSSRPRARPPHGLPLRDPTRSTSSAGTATCGRSAFDIADFQPITGRVHQPPPVHQTFPARNFVVCSFVPRKFDYHPLAIPAPYNHSNINSDEVIYYVAGNFMSRRGVGIASFTLHPAGIPHGPHPGTAEASIGKEATEELAVMVDTFRPLYLPRQQGAREPELPVHLAAGRPRRGKPATSPSAAPRRSRTDLATAGRLRAASAVSRAGRPRDRRPGRAPARRARATSSEVTGGRWSGPGR